MKIFDDVISEQSQINLEKLFSDPAFPWYFNASTIGDNPQRGSEYHLASGYPDAPQFVHSFVNANDKENTFCSPALEHIMTYLGWDDLVEKLSLPKYIIRIKSNLLLPVQQKDHPPHMDYDMPHKVMIYYVKDSDGPTKFYKRDGDNFIVTGEVMPKRGRFLVFPGNTYHSSTAPTNYDSRCVINFNLCDYGRK